MIPPAPRPPGALIGRVVDVTKTYERGRETVFALRGANFELGAGELLAVMGPSGSGKSTLLNVTGGLDAATSGEVWLCGERFSMLKARALAAVRRRVVGYVFQDLNLLPTLTVAENVALPLELDGWRPGKAAAAATISLEACGMQAFARRLPRELSGGEQQQVAIARALVGARCVVLADEPTGALDSATGDTVLALLRERCDAGVAAIVVTHQPRHAAWADRVVFLKDGAIVDDSDADLWPATPFGGPADAGYVRQVGN
jgi:putative ABC transport system ATP-binding protein